MRPHRLALLTLLLASVSAAPPPQDAFLQLFPELKRLPAPPWVAEGVRLTYSAAAASIGFDTDTPVGSGAGFTTVDVVAVDGSHVVLDITSWGTVPGGRMLLARTGQVSIPSAGGEFWLHPDVLRHATDKESDDLEVVRTQTKTHGRDYEVIRFQDEGEDHRYVHQFDITTGILVWAATRVGQEDGKRTQTDTQFISRRRIDRSWLNQPPPAWIATVRGFTLQGSLSTTIPGSPEMGGRPMRGTATVTQRGARWFQCDVNVNVESQQGLPSAHAQSRIVSGIAQVGGLWLPPAALSALRQGQVLDEDPTVGTRQVVTGADGQWVLINYGSPIDSTDSLYEVSSGQLVRSRRSQQIGVATQVLDVTFQRQ